MPDQQQIQGPILQEALTSIQTGAKTYAATHYLAVIAILGILVAGLGAYIGIREADKLIARADAAEAKYDADKKAWQQELTADRAQYNQLAQAQTGQQKVIVEREQVTAQTVSQVTAPNQTTQAVADYSTKYLGVTPEVTQNDKLAYLPKDVQDFVADKINLDALQQSYMDRGTILQEEQQKNSLLQKDNDTKSAQIKESEAVKTDYKVAAKGSKFKTAIHYAGEAALVVGGAVLASHVK